MCGFNPEMTSHQHGNVMAARLRAAAGDRQRIRVFAPPQKGLADADRRGITAFAKIAAIVF